YVTCVTPIERTASPTDRPCDNSTSTWRSFATISSGLCFFWGIPTSSYGSKTYFREDHFSGGRPQHVHGVFLALRYFSGLVIEGQPQLNLWTPSHKANFSGLVIEGQPQRLGIEMKLSSNFSGLVIEGQPQHADGLPDRSRHF